MAWVYNVNAVELVVEIITWRNIREKNMSNPLRFIVAAMQEVPWPEMVTRWQYLDTHGLDGVMLADHFVDFSNPTAHWYECWTLLAALATQTETIHIGLLSATPWRNPAFLARQAMTVDHISNGRLYLGLGAGAPGDVDISYAMTGTPDWPPRERVDRFHEVVEIVDQLLRNPETTYDGKYYHIKGTVMNPLPIQKPRPPLMVGGNGPRMQKIAARYADTWNTFGGVDIKSSAEMLSVTCTRNTLMNRFCEEIGRDPSSLRRSVLIYTHEDYQQLYSVPGAFEDIVKRYMEIGITEFIFFYPFVPMLMPMFEQIINEAIPRLRAADPVTA
jgi:alkanesulfonate monooxygenase SsuD/methylene tetrahydromethanopterin reductase-like flavin-dependent oxidoreductase (luciferase family)